MYYVSFPELFLFFLSYLSMQLYISHLLWNYGRMVNKSILAYEWRISSNSGNSDFCSRMSANSARPEMHYTCLRARSQVLLRAMMPIFQHSLQSSRFHFAFPC